MNLHSQQLGSGPDVVLLHGWGLHSGVFSTLAEQLAAHYRVTLIDLPGHGRSPAPSQSFDLATLSEQVAAAAPPRATWLGWSLGGLIAMHLALTAPARVDKLILVNSSPRFVTADDWPCAMDPAVLAGFAQALQEDYRATLERFLALQIAPGAEGRETLRRLRDLLLHPPRCALPIPAPQTLNDGLAILRSADLRARLAALRCPTLLILGKQDRLVPAAVGPAVQALVPTAHVEIIKGAGHAPFLSHQREFLTALSRFLEDEHLCPPRRGAGHD